MKKILVLTGSPRKGGNTDMLTEAFIRGAGQAGHEIHRFDVARMRVTPCIACDKCFSKGEACIQKDEFNTIAPLFESCDTLALAMPVYWFSFPANIKTAIDKIYSLHVGQRAMTIRESVLLSCAEDTDPGVFDGLCRSYEQICSFKEWKDRGRVLVRGVNRKGDIAGNEGLGRAEALGRSL